MTQKMQVLFFGKLADRIGRSVDVPADRATVGGLREALAARFPEVRADLMKPSLRACVGDELVPDEFALDGVGRVEFFPPLSGG